jgi:hypothetical protein
MLKAIGAVVCACGLLAGLNTPWIGQARSEIVLNFPVPKPSDSREASAQLLLAMSIVVRSVSLAELGQAKEAEKLFADALSSLRNSREKFQTLAKLIKGGDVRYDKLTGQITREKVDEIFKKYAVDPPKTQDALAALAVREVDKFIEVSQGIKFGDPDSARASVLGLSSSMGRLLDIGVAVSAISHTI